MCSEQAFTPEEELLADQIAKNAGLVVECPRHPRSYYKAHSRMDTINKLDTYLMRKQDSLLGLISRSDIQKKALVIVALRQYREHCLLCKPD